MLNKVSEWTAFLLAKIGKNRARNSIILGTDYAEYKLCKVLQKKGEQVKFFISDDPWKYDTSIEGVVCRYPSELFVLCIRHQIDSVYYCDESWLKRVKNLPKKSSLKSSIKSRAC